MSDQEVNFARAIIGERSYRDVPTDEVLREAQALLRQWMNGEVRMERPKLYDHYALLLLALLDKNRELEARLSALESAALEAATPASKGATPAHDPATPEG